ncbi:MAG: non-homologous end-joining DNA ligase [Acidimicrobiales bacterium]
MKLTFGRYHVDVTSPDKLYFPDDGITKGEVVAYYELIAGIMLPHVAGRPVSMQRFPSGIGRPGFFHKDAPEHFPDWIERVRVPKEDGTVDHAVIRKAADLVYLAGYGTITPHVWLATVDDLDRPDRMIFDLDPSVDDFDTIKDGARMLRDLLNDLGLVPYLMTTGSRGLHIVVPVRRTEHFDNVRDFARSVAERLVSHNPDRFTTEVRKAKRGDRVFVDYLRNAYAQTAVPPYAVRPRPRAPIAVPVTWDSLDDPELISSRYTIRDAEAILARDDPWAGIARRARSLSEPADRLGMGRPPH